MYMFKANSNKSRTHFKISLKTCIYPLLLFAMSVQAQQEDIEKVAIYGRVDAIPVNQLHTSVFVFNQQDIRRLNAVSALDIIKNIPGVAISRSGNTQDIYLRGAETNFVVIQLDGVQINNPVDTRGGSVDLSAIAKSSVQRIEVFKGAQSSVYGSDAIAGVINIITLDNRNTGSEFHAAVLPGGNKLGALRLTGEKLSVRASLSKSDVLANTQQSRTAEVATAIDLLATDRHTATVTAVLNDYTFKGLPDQSGGTRYATDPAKERKEGRWLSTSMLYQYNASENHKSAARVEYFNTEESLTSPGIAPYFNAPPGESDHDYQFFKVRLLHQMQPSVTARSLPQLSFGADYKSESGENSGQMELFGQSIDTDFIQERDTLSVFTDVFFPFAEGAVSFSARHDNTSQSNASDIHKTTWKAGGNLDITKHLTAYINAGTAFKLPSHYALGNNLVGNSKLRSEEARNLEMGVNWHSPTSSISLSLFHYQYTDLIDFDASTFSLVNRERVRSKGAEWVVSNTIDKWISVAGSVTYVDTEAQSGVLLNHRPNWQATASVQLKLSDAFHSSVAGRYQSSVYATSLHTGEVAQFTLPAHAVIDISTTLVLADNHSLSVYLENLFNKTYYTAVGSPAEERSVGVQYSYYFR